MLVEIFTDTIFDETVCDPSRGIESRKVPKTVISEKGNPKLHDMYLVARNFLVNALDRPQYGLSKGCHYMLEIECVPQHDLNVINAVTERRLDEKKFLFKFSSLRSYDKPYDGTVHGEVVIDEDLNVVEFKREKIYVRNDSAITCTTLNRSDSCCTGTISKATEYDPVEVDDSCEGESTVPFVNSCQQEVPTDSSEGADSVTNESPVELSKNSFSVEDRTIDVSDPNLGIGSVEGSFFSVDLEKQKKHDEFFRNMSGKISRRNNNRRHCK